MTNPYRLENVGFINRDKKSIYVPSSIDFKMYNFILTEKDYLSRLYLDTDITRKNEKQNTSKSRGIFSYNI